MENVDTNKVEEILADIKNSLDNDAKVSEEIAKNADTLISAQVAKFEEFAKTVEALSAKLDAINESIAALQIPTKEEIEKAVNDKAEEIAKSVEEKTEALSKKVEELENEPMQKSATVVYEDENVVEEVVEAPAPTRQDLINKALNELQTTTDYNRKTQLFKAVSRLEAGVSLDKVTF